MVEDPHNWAHIIDLLTDEVGANVGVRVPINESLQLGTQCNMGFLGIHSQGVENASMEFLFTSDLGNQATLLHVGIQGWTRTAKQGLVVEMVMLGNVSTYKLPITEHDCHDSHSLGSKKCSAMYDRVLVGT